VFRVWVYIHADKEEMGYVDVTTGGAWMRVHKTKGGWYSIIWEQYVRLNVGRDGEQEVEGETEIELTEEELKEMLKRIEECRRRNDERRQVGS